MAHTPGLHPSLPTRWYIDADHYQRELETIWYRDWVAVGRLEQVPEKGDFFIAGIGTQQIIVTRGNNGALHAFHNTCRHRGSILCTEKQGHFRNGRIICPYHTWTYGLDGQLVATPFKVDSGDFDANKMQALNQSMGSMNLGGYPAAQPGASPSVPSACGRKS